MKYEVVSCSDLNGTEVIGVVDADNEAVAGQLANERFKPSMRSEDIYVRPVREVKKAEPAPMVREQDVYSFKCEGYGHRPGNDELCVTISRELLLRTLTDILEEGLGKDSDTFYVNFYGRLSLSEM